ncbi:MAG: hypothetical protein LBQ76_00370 [Candidatus Fibromonas sp.]|jgi:hypothetical protein|nr:hypothetical protein [Candidatus Fibromonas sp.]
MRILAFLAFFCFAATSSFAQKASKDSISGDSQDTSSANKAVFADVTIFSQMPIGSIYVLWSNFDVSEDIKRIITTRNFVLEPYFMQNIDREQFEQKQMLHLFYEQKKAFFKLFPDEEDED